MRAIGDLATYIISRHMHDRLQSEADRAAFETTTGMAKDRTRHLGGSSLAVSLLERKSQLLEQHRRGVSEAALFGTTSQTILGRIQDQAAVLANSLSLVSQVQLTSEVETLSATAAATFHDTVRALNSEVGGRHLFAGSATGQRPLLDGQSLTGMLRAHVSGTTDPDAIRSAVEAWFDTPGGPFETMAYTGSATGFAMQPIGPDETVVFGLRADSETIRDLLKALSVATLASDPALALSLADQKRLLDHVRGQLSDVDRTLTEERATLGLIEARIETARGAVDADLDRVSLDRLALIGVDQFQAASEFEAVQQQLDVFYRVSARRERVSLAEYLR
ncbi:MAG: hypothetical protein MRY75_06470 [Marivita sp.]|uniref:flagellin n=1 Tax=Marivita sp. TaxID=2003365 RepID=UPI0025C32D1A|nr:flagellin [Marivita sp.]MCI5110181.1 hypothetical protein [Marivita sp.]